MKNNPYVTAQESITPEQTTVQEKNITLYRISRRKDADYLIYLLPTDAKRHEREIAVNGDNGDYTFHLANGETVEIENGIAATISELDAEEEKRVENKEIARSKRYQLQQKFRQARADAYNDALELTPVPQEFINEAPDHMTPREFMGHLDSAHIWQEFADNGERIFISLAQYQQVRGVAGRVGYMAVPMTATKFDKNANHNHPNGYISIARDISHNWMGIASVICRKHDFAPVAYEILPYNFPVELRPVGRDVNINIFVSLDDDGNERFEYHYKMTLARPDAPSYAPSMMVQMRYSRRDNDPYTNFSRPETAGSSPDDIDEIAYMMNLIATIGRRWETKPIQFELVNDRVYEMTENFVVNYK